MGKFEENWAAVFERAEVPPSDLVWATIDSQLADGEVMKKRIVLYQRIAAASVLFALLVGSFGIYRWKARDPQLAQQENLGSELTSKNNEKKIVNKENNRTSPATSVKKEGLKPINQDKEIAQNKSLLGTSPDLTSSNSKSNHQSSSLINDKGNESNKKLITSNSNRIATGPQIQNEHKMIADVEEKKLFEKQIGPMPELRLLPIPQIKDGPVIVEIVRKLPAIPGAFMVKKENKVNHEHLWASMTAAAGSYSPNTNSYSSYNYAAGAQVASSSSSSSIIGTSYSFGVLAGIRVTRKVVIQSGVQYMNQSIGSESNISAPGSLDAVANYAANSSSSYSTTSPYSITSANEFVSVPVQAGYLFVDRKIGLQLNSGVSTDFFIRNTLSDPSGQRQSYSQSAGSDSPYRSVNFAGLMSSEVSYKLGNRYRVSVVPG